MSAFTDWLRSMQRREEDIRRDERARIAADLERRASGIRHYLAYESQGETPENKHDMGVVATCLANTAWSLTSTQVVNQREPDRAP